jgi:hypothetical protein
MYNLICRNEQIIISTINKEHGVPQYEWLISNIGQAHDTNYQNEFKKFWMMKQAHLGDSFDQAYFTALSTGEPTPSLRSFCQTLHQFPRLRGDRALQFSFVTKLRHMLNRKLPIYDDRVASFYLFQSPSRTLPLTQRINGLITFHNFLIHEYRRVLSTGLLENPLAAFKQQFNNSPAHTDTKIIDWLIYGFVRLADKGQIAGL